jgi:hypothetical protein
VVKSHGGADALGFASTIDIAIDMGSSDMIARISADHAGVSFAGETDDAEPRASGAGKAQAVVS